MTRDRVIVAMLGAIAILLALNLLRGEPEAQAQAPPPFDSAEPMVVSVTMGKDRYASTAARFRVIRAWSDGSVDMTSVTFNNNTGALCEIEATCGPVSIILPP